MTNSKAKLSEDDVKKIRSSSDVARVEAKKFGVCIATIRRVRRGDNWSHIHMEEVK